MIVPPRVDLKETIIVTIYETSTDNRFDRILTQLIVMPGQMVHILALESNVFFSFSRTLINFHWTKTSVAN